MIMAMQLPVNIIVILLVGILVLFVLISISPSAKDFLAGVVPFKKELLCREMQMSECKDLSEDILRRCEIVFDVTSAQTCVDRCRELKHCLE